ncbi:MAG: hypothetical protein ACOQNV_00640 [Mycoplasmoidaceae bacterium]
MKKKDSKIKFDESVHYTIKNRKRYKAKLWLVFVAMTIILVGCSAMFYFGNYSWDPEAGFSPGANPREPYQVALVVLASIISVGVLVGTFLFCWFDIGKFYKTQELYFKSNKFKENKAKALNGDITKLRKSTIKWYKKMGYITSDEKREILAKQQARKVKAKEEKQPVNN